MKKLLTFVSIICMILVYTMPLQAQNEITNDAVEYVTATDVEKLADKYIEVISEKLKVPSEFMYEALMEQAVMKANAYLIINVVLLILSLIFIIAHYSMPKDRYSYNDFYWLPIILSGLFIIFLMSTMVPMITGYLNPDYFVVKEILHTFKPPAS